VMAPCANDRSQTSDARHVDPPEIRLDDLSSGLFNMALFSKMRDTFKGTSAR
jgi:hypothetical protein